jgi:hypothetical protein
MSENESDLMFQNKLRIDSVATEKSQEIYYEMCYLVKQITSY